MNKKTFPTTLRSVNWRQPALLMLALVLVASLGLIPANVSAAMDSPRVHPALLTMAEHTPQASAPVIIRRTAGGPALDALVVRRGGQVIRPLPLIDGIVAEIPAGRLPDLGRAAGVRWISPDAPMVEQTCTTCTDTSRANAAWRQAIGMRDLRSWYPAVQGQGVTVAVIDSGVAAHPDLMWNSSAPRVVNINPIGQISAASIPPSGLVHSETSIPGSRIDLWREGTADWARWRWQGWLNQERPWSTVPQAMISNLSLIGQQPAGSLSGSTSYTLSDRDSGSREGVLASGAGAGMHFSVPADRTLRTLRVYTGLTSGTGRFEAFLSDGSALPFTQRVSAAPGASVFRTFVITYAAAQDGQRLTVRWTSEGATGGVAIFASSLSNSGRDPRPVVQTNSGAEDQYGHGTLVAGVVGGSGVASNGAVVGVAPQVNIVNVRVISANGSATASDVIAGLQWIHTNRTQHNIRVVNMSLNSSVAESYHTSALSAAVEILWFSGIVVVVSAGNNGDNGVLYPPANDPFVITVGAVDDRGTATRDDDVIAGFSARGLTEAGTRKPEIVAPGVNIVSLNCDQCTLNQTYRTNVASGFDGASRYFRASGTSLAAPMVAGTVALMLQHQPHLNPDQVKQRLMLTGYHAPFGWEGPAYLHAAWAVTSSSTDHANQNLEVSRALFTGTDPLVLDSARWSSARWSSARWSSARWSSVNWGSPEMQASMRLSVDSMSRRAPAMITR